MVGLSIGYINASAFSHSLRSYSPLNGEERDFLASYDAMEFPDFEMMAFIYKSKNDENVMTISHFQRVFDYHAYLMAYNNGQLFN